MKTKYKYFKHFKDAFIYYNKSTAWYYKSDFSIRYSLDDKINGRPARSISLYNKDTGEVIAYTDFHYSLCGKYVVITHDFS